MIFYEWLFHTVLNSIRTHAGWWGMFCVLLCLINWVAGLILFTVIFMFIIVEYFIYLMRQM